MELEGIPSIWDGWSSKTQTHGHAINFGYGRKFWILPTLVKQQCAWHYADSNARYSDEAREATFNRVAQYLAEMFPHDAELQMFAQYGGGLCAVIKANDELHVPAETFIYLDKLSQYEEGMRQIQKQVEEVRHDVSEVSA